MEQPDYEMPRPDFGARKAASPSEEVRTPNENDLLITRLVARIAELEERLYKKELEAPAIDGNGAPGDPIQQQQEQQQQEHLMRTPIDAITQQAPRFRDSFLATLRESWAKLELHAGGGGGGSSAATNSAFSSATAAAAAAVAATASTTAALPMRSLDAVASPMRAGAPAGAGEVRAKVAGNADHARGGPVDVDNATGLHGQELSMDGLQTGNFNFSTHLVVDYSKPNSMTPRAPGRPRRKRGNKGASSGGREGSRGEDIGGNSSDRSSGGGVEEGSSGNDGDGDSLSSVGSSGMVYDTLAEEQALERRRSSMTGAPGPKGPSVTAPGAHGSASPTSHVKVGGGPRPPLPLMRQRTGSRCGSDSGGAPMTLTAPSATCQQPRPPQPQQQQQSQSSGAAPSRAAVWSGQVLSKLGITWGRDRGGAADPQDGGGVGGGGGVTRNASAGSLQRPFPLFRQSTMGNGTGLGSGPLNAASTEAAFNDRALEKQLAAGGGLTADTAGGAGRYYRYVFDPADVQAEMEVTARVRRAAAQALMEANTKLAEAQAAAAALQQQVEQAKQLEQELEVLRAERSAAQAAKAAMEDEMATARRQLEAMKETETSLQAELESVRSQAEIWRCSKGGEPEKLKQENTLLRSQLTNRLSELQSCRTRLSEGEAERQRLMREAEELQNKIQWLTKINLQLETAASQLNDVRRSAAEWQERFMRERNVRRRLHNQLQQLRGNIRVMCRVRPVTVGQRDIVSYPLEGLLAISPPDKKYQEFEFDHVFPPSASQVAVFEEAVASLVRSVVDGHSACVLAYGQAGSGKTYTLHGTTEDPGISLRALRELIRIATEESGAAGATATATVAATGEELATAIGGGRPATAAAALVAGSGNGDDAAATKEGAASVAGIDVAGATSATVSTAAVAATGCPGRYSLWVSMSEVYNEEVYDLLAPGIGEEGSVPRALEVSMLGPGELPPGTDRVPGLTWRLVGSMEVVEALLQEGGRNRATVAAALNLQQNSSRCHGLLSVRVEAAEGGMGGNSVVSVLHLVDLAGSERAEKSDISGQQAKLQEEAQSINRSLAALGDVISALQRRSANVPFRSSKLMTVLQDTLCGDAKVLLLCNIAPEATSAAETMCSLNFASRAAQLELAAAAHRSGSWERITDPSPKSPVLQDRILSDRSSGGGGTVSRSGVASAQSTSPLHLHPPLPIMNGTAAKVRAAAAAAAAVMSAASGPGGGSGMRMSQGFIGMNGVIVSATNSADNTSGGGGGGGGSSGGSSQA